MKIEPEELYALLMALFRSDAELQRFLVLEGYPVERLIPAVKAAPSLSRSASEAARNLVALDLVDDRLFAALRRRSPERAADIDTLARSIEVTQPSERQNCPNCGYPIPPERPDFCPNCGSYLGWDDWYDASEAPPPSSTEASDADMPVYAPGKVSPPPVHVERSATPPAAAAPGEAEPDQTMDPQTEEFRRLLQADLAELDDLDSGDPALESDRWPWTGAAAVLGAFRPSPVLAVSPDAPVELALRPLPGTQPPDSAPVALAELVHTVADGRWVLRDEARIPCLKRLSDGADGFGPALAANAMLPDPRRDMFHRIIDGGQIQLYTLGAAQLNDLDVVLGWLEQIGHSLPIRRVDVHAAAERRRLIDPLRALVGEHFRGREAELATLRAHIRPIAGTNPILCLHGPGGVGKSSLIGRLLLDLEERASWDPVPFAYLDFDRRIHDPRKPVGLIEQIARQLRLLYASAEEAVQFTALESTSAGDDYVVAAEVLQIESGLDLDALIGVLAQRLAELHSHSNDPAAASLVLVLDTFEEVQAKGPGAVHDVLGLIDRLRAALPGTRVIIAGRSVLAVPSAGTTTLVLGDLDPAAADAVLANRGIADPGIRSLIIERFGGNPLTLRLAAEALSRLDSAEAAFDGVVAQADALAEVAKEQIQGMLYSRILGHIRDPEVVRVAHPGLTVRLVTVDVLREVLAEPCGLDPERAEMIFDRLRSEVSMFELVDDHTLRHREDVRQLMLRTMSHDPAMAAKVIDIHRRAADFYTRRSGPAAKAEELYHRLMSGENPRELEELWRMSRPAERPPSPDELPVRARVWLERRLGLAPDAGREEWEQEDWEAEAAERVASWLASGDAGNAIRVLDERSERLEGSRLPAYEVAAATAAGQLDRAAQTLDTAMRTAVRDQDWAAQLDLAEQAVLLRIQQNDVAGVVEAARTAAAAASLTGERGRALEILIRAINELRDHGDPQAAASLGPELASHFVSFDRAAMRRAPNLVRQILRGVGADEPSVLLHAATEVGDLTEVFVGDAYALSRLLRETTAAASPALGALARTVGAPWSPRGGDLVRLTSQAVRLGRIGEVIKVGLDYAQDLTAASTLVANELVGVVDKESSHGIPVPGRRHA